MIGFIWKMGYSRKMASSGKKKGRSRLRVVSLHLFLRSMMPSYTILTAQFGQVLLHWDVLHLGHAGPIAVHHGLPSQIAPCFAELKGDACLRQETLPMLVKEMLLLSFLGSVFLGKISYRWIQAMEIEIAIFVFSVLMNLTQISGPSLSLLRTSDL